MTSAAATARRPLSLRPVRDAGAPGCVSSATAWAIGAWCCSSPWLSLSLFAEVLSNDRPLVVRYEGKMYFPVLRDYSEKTFGGDFETPTDYLDPFIRERITHSGNWAIYAPNPYGPKTLNYFAKSPSPAAPSRDNWLGTDDRGRDLLAQLIYGFRVSVLFGLALTAHRHRARRGWRAPCRATSAARPTSRSSALSRSGARCPSSTC